ncbi:MAG: RNA 2',3'-cyclic phosphodiesterase [Desulfitobacteriaceae bacterium]|nr:RNA 2',3'-cyclic phosphodiesterase [Desulfitobacteriaceae bacterium]
MRLFVGIDLPEQLKEELAKFQSELKQLGVKAFWKSLENFHITLEFLGELEPGNVPVISNALIKGAKQSKPYYLKVIGLGAFPSLIRPRVLWTRVSGNLIELNKLQANIHHELLEAGFTLENRAFKSHITLASRPELPEANYADFKKRVFGEFLVSEFALIESKVIRGKRIYTSIKKIVLRD